MRITIVCAAVAVACLGAYAMIADQDDKGWAELTPEEAHIIVYGGTERPFTGEYLNNKEKGTYACRRCHTPLYRSDDKFESGCGWPSFDDEIPGAVRRTPDPDGRRTEIVCANCDGHLGHVFLGEGFTEKDTRHCVNSLAMRFIPAAGSSEAEDQAKEDEVKTERAIFAGGCFWGVEYYFLRAEGVLKTQVGYIGGRTENPTYHEVCNEDTGHAEATEVIYDPEKTDFETMAKLFFEIHDPTQLNRQGPDIGPQYRSAVYYLDDEQRKITEKLIGILKEKGYDVVTEVVKAPKFWPAEDYHQQYYEKQGSTPYCHFYTKRF